ncbi:hypothetical protein EMIT0P294_70011 [Pseudomonas sp. IT-P294]
MHPQTYNMGIYQSLASIGSYTNNTTNR